METPKSVPDPWEKGKVDLSDIEHEIANPTPDLNADHRRTKDKQYTQIMGPNNGFGVPTMEEIGIDRSLATTPHRGGESVALKMLADFIADEEYIGTFEKPRLLQLHSNLNPPLSSLHTCTLALFLFESTGGTSKTL